MKIFGLCSGCNKNKFFIANRVVKLKNPAIPVTSNNKLCGRCIKNIKRMVNQPAPQSE